MGNQAQVIASAADGTAAGNNTSSIVGTPSPHTNATAQNITTAFNGASLQGYLYGAGSSGSYTLPATFTIPALGNVQIRSFQITLDCEAGYLTTSLPIGYQWAFTLGLQGLPNATSTGNVYAFSNNATIPDHTSSTATLSGGIDSNGAGAANSIVWAPSVFGQSPVVRQTTSADAQYRGFPEWISTSSNDPTEYTTSGGLNGLVFLSTSGTASPTMTGYDISSAVPPSPGWDTATQGFLFPTGQTFTASASLLLGTSTSPIPSQGFNIQGPLDLIIGYNAAPSTGTVTINGSSGSVTLNTTVPTVNWSYTDPENDPQAGFVVLVWASGSNAGTGPSIAGLWPKQTGGTNNSYTLPGGPPLNIGGSSGGLSLTTPTVSMLNFGAGYTWQGVLNNYVVQPVWCSGLISTAAQSYTIPAGVLQGGNAYTIQVLVTDTGSQGRYSSYTAGLINVTLTSNPLLAPGFTPQLTIGGSSQPSYALNTSNGQLTLPVKPRVNLLTVTDAGFFNSATSSFVVVGTVAAGTATATSPGNVITATGANMTWTGDTVQANPGDLYTATLDVKCSSAVRTLNLSMLFNNSSGTLIGTATRASFSSVGSTNFTETWVQAWAPSGTATITIVLAVPNSANAETYTITRASISNGLTSLLNNADFEIGSSFWTLTTAASGAGAIALAGSTCDSDESAAMGTDVYGVSVTASTSDSATLTPTSFIDMHGTQFVLSAAAINKTSTTTFPLTLKVVDNASTLDTPSATVTVPAGGTWKRVSQIANCTATANTAFNTISVGLPLSSGGPFSVQLDNLIFQPLWPLTNLTMAAGTSGSNLPVVLALGAASNTLGWFSEVGAAKWDNTHVRGAETVALEVLNGTTASQLFSVSGYTSLALAFWYFQTTGNTTMTVTFYDSAAMILWQSNGTQSLTANGAVTGVYSQVSFTAPVPTGAAFAKLSFTTSAGTNSWVTDVTNTPTGTLGPMPYINGGWSEGIGGTSPAVVVQRSVNDGLTWTTLRYGATTPAAPQTLGTGAPTVLTYTDLEYPLIAADQNDTSTSRPIYQAFLSLTNPSYGGTSPTSLIRSFYRDQITTWWLIDLLNPTQSVALNVKDVKFSITENMAKFSGLGRSRIVVIGDTTVQGDVITMDLFSFSSTDYANYMVQLRKQTVLLLRSPDGEQWYVRPTKRDRERIWTGTYQNQLRTHAIELQEIDQLA